MSEERGLWAGRDGSDAPGPLRTVPDPRRGAVPEARRSIRAGDAARGSVASAVRRPAGGSLARSGRRRGGVRHALGPAPGEAQPVPRAAEVMVSGTRPGAAGRDAERRGGVERSTARARRRGRWRSRIITRTAAGVAVARDAPRSRYHSRFTQGATLVPRFPPMVEDAPAPPLGVAAGTARGAQHAHRQREAALEGATRLEGAVEQQFVRPVHLGSTLLPFRLLEPWRGIVPWDGETLLERANPHLDIVPRARHWWTRAEAVGTRTTARTA